MPQTRKSIEPFVQKADLFVLRCVLQPWRDYNSEFCRAKVSISQQPASTSGSEVFQVPNIAAVCAPDAHQSAFIAIRDLSQ